MKIFNNKIGSCLFLSITTVYSNIYTMTHPKLIFKKDIEFDNDIGTYFLNDIIDGFDFGQDRIISEHPVFADWRELEEKELAKKVQIYVKDYYAIHADEMAKSMKKMQILWDSIATDYFKAVEGIFGNLDFYTPTELTAILSIFKVGVVGEDIKSFQIWYKTIKEPEEVLRHIAHEILHFYYYTYTQIHGYDAGEKHWELAEIFNVIILNLPQFKALIKKEELGYAQHAQLIPKYRKIWNQSDDINSYLEKTITKGGNF